MPTRFNKSISHSKRQSTKNRFSQSCTASGSVRDQGQDKVIAVISRKGGAAKTTTSVNLAAALASRCRVALVDMDPQQSAAKWSGAAVTVLDPSALKSTLDLVDADIVVVDTPPLENAPARAAFELASFVVVPIQPSPLDLEAAAPILRAIVNSGKPGLVVLTMVNPRTRATASARRHLAAQEVPLARSLISRRTAHIQAAAKRLPVIKFEPRSKAADEVRSLADEVWELLGGCQ